MTTKISAPKHFSREAKAWYADVVSSYVLDAHHLKLLRLACEAWDRIQEARAAIAEHGTTYLDRFKQPKARPEVAIERDGRLAFARLVRELALDESEPEESRPPRIIPRKFG